MDKASQLLMDAKTSMVMARAHLEQSDRDFALANQSMEAVKNLMASSRRNREYAEQLNAHAAELMAQAAAV
jgi:hypothetical protein